MNSGATVCDEIEVLVVDPRPEDYVHLAVGCADGGYAFRFAATGRDALRMPRSGRPRLWLINMHLPDMSGRELRQALRMRDSRDAMYLVGDEYALEDELQARQSAAVYLCKPAEKDWVAVRNQSKCRRMRRASAASLAESAA